MTRQLDPTSFLENRRKLENPTPEAVRDAFAGLPRRGSLEVQCRWSARGSILEGLESAGAFAIRVDPLPAFVEVRITAFKGKAGSCFETGRTATYTGAARAVVDDDGHLVAGSIRVCEKTGGLYTLPPYEGLLEVTDGDADKIQRLDLDPIPFDCNTFEADAARIAEGPLLVTLDSDPEGGARDGDGLRSVVYPGPFRSLVLADGSIVRRGQPVRIRAALVKELAARDGLVVLPEKIAGEAEPAASYPALHAVFGAGALLDAVAVGAKPNEVSTASEVNTASEAPPEVPPRGWLVLRAAPEEIQARLARCLERAEPYFILTGSDPRDSGGCCPNTLVGAANGLVEDGVLAAYRAPAPPDACTTTVYAFAGEIRLEDGRPRFRIRPEIRRKALEVLGKASKPSSGGTRSILRILLVGLLTVSFALAVRRVALDSREPERDFAAVFASAVGSVPDGPRVIVCLFRGREHCEACDGMGRVARGVVAGQFAAEARSGRLSVIDVRHDLPENTAIRRELGLATSTIGLARQSRGTLERPRILTGEVWSVWPDEERLADLLRTEIRSALDRPGG